MYKFYSSAPSPTPHPLPRPVFLMHHDALNWILKEGRSPNEHFCYIEIGPVVSDKKISKVFYKAIKGK